jgi:hypothetical protein
MVEAFAFFEEECLKLDLSDNRDDGRSAAALHALLEGRSAVQFLKKAKLEILEERATETMLGKMIALLLVVIHRDTVEANRVLATKNRGKGTNAEAAPIHRS